MKKRQKKKNDKNLQFRTVTLKHGFYRQHKSNIRKQYETSILLTRNIGLSIYPYWKFGYPNRFRVSTWIDEELKRLRRL